MTELDEHEIKSVAAIAVLLGFAFLGAIVIITVLAFA